ncbi:hypothetical protein PHAVU_004G156300 [Phaseolus vulgaris]|uniref:VQ domain-containing protein n=1 Tax=Phaseolus vulgaris TaxID=3885 RepID=V7C3P8_PHAVU|nr:hypothetical protein PHAVU_004G156300g [Phaseolus vulgaris]ESW24744.1 hypothetical protein PHAVU_004G156300g [Phaseolus vulgaris]
MSPSQFHPKKELTTNNKNNTNGLLPPPLKINKESHLIKKSSSSPPQSSSSSSSSISSSLVNNAMTQAMPTPSYRPQQQRHPVIIYTHSPKVIHTQPKDFMSLVQKLTGLTRAKEEEDDDDPPPQQSSKQESGGSLAAVIGDKESDGESMIIVRNEENEASSVITEENNCIGENQVNSCFMAGEGAMLEPPLNPYVTMLPPSSGKFVCSSQPLMNYSDSLFFSHNLRTTLEGRKEFHEH